MTSLQEELNAADFDRLVDFPEDLVEAEYISLIGADIAVERAEVALRHAHVRVVDVPVDDVSDCVAGVLAPADVVGQTAQHMRGRVQVQLERLVRTDATTVADFPDDALDIHRVTVRRKPDSIKPRRLGSRHRTNLCRQLIKLP